MADAAAAAVPQRNMDNTDDEMAVDIVSTIREHIESIDSRISELVDSVDMFISAPFCSSSSSTSASSNEILALESQKRVYMLLEMLSSEDVSHEAASPPSPPSSHALWIDAIISSSSSLTRQSTALEWLQQTYPKFTVPTDWEVPFNRRTIVAATRSRSSSSSSSMDPDSIDGHLHPQDQAQEDMFWKYVFGLLRIGDMSSAISLCQCYGEHSRAISISGAEPFNGIDSGNRRRWLWRHTLASIAAASASSSDSIWKTGVYSVLGGVVEGVYACCDTFMDYVWAAISCAHTRSLDAALHAHLSSLPSDVQAVALSPSSSQHLMPVHHLSISELISNAKAAFLSSSASSGSIISSYDVISTLALDDCVYEIFSELSSPSSVYHMPSYIEFASNVYLLLRESRDDGFASLTQRFISSLCIDRHHLIPHLVSSLPHDIAVDTFSAFVSSCTDPIEREYYLDRASSLFSASLMDDITSRMLVLVEPDVSSDSAVSASIDRLIQVQQLQPSPSAHASQANIFFRALVQSHRIPSALDLANRLSTSSAAAAASTSSSSSDAELQGWMRFCSAISSMDSLERACSSSPSSSSLKGLLDVCSANVCSVLTSDRTWLSDAVSLRSICLPELVDRFISVCLSAGSPWTALSISCWIADDVSRAYTAFDTTHLHNVLTTLSRAYLVAASSSSSNAIIQH